MYLLDTDILSNLMTRTPSAALFMKLAYTSADDLFTSSITIGELTYGAYRATRRTQEILRRIDESINLDLTILPFDTAAARWYGELRAYLERRGTPIGDADMRIAAIALARGLRVVTGNTRHFQRVPDLSVENWLLPDGV